MHNSNYKNVPPAGAAQNYVKIVRLGSLLNENTCFRRHLAREYSRFVPPGETSLAQGAKRNGCIHRLGSTSYRVKFYKLAYPVMPSFIFFRPGVSKSLISVN